MECFGAEALVTSPQIVTAPGHLGLARHRNSAMTADEIAVREANIAAQPYAAGSVALVSRPRRETSSVHGDFALNQAAVLYRKAHLRILFGCA
jgi:hypothetical protein